MIILLLALFALMIGMAAADNEEKEKQLQETDAAHNNPTTSEEKNLKFNFEQNVSGTGFFTAYKYAQMPDALGTQGRLFNGVEAKTEAHGSGKIDTDSNMSAESSYTNKTWINGAYDEDGEVIQEEESISIVQLNEDSKMTYSPLAMGIGSRYYDLHPITFNVLLKEEDWIKNRNGLNSLHHRVDQAHGLNMVLDAQSDATNNTMNLEEDLVDGRAHFGVLQLEGIPVDEELEDGSEETQGRGYRTSCLLWLSTSAMVAAPGTEPGKLVKMTRVALMHLSFSDSSIPLASSPDCIFSMT